MNLCSSCGQEMRVGDWPFCESGGGHRPARTLDAKAFDAILVFEMADGTHSYPGHNDPLLAPTGAKPIFLDTLRKADEFVRNTNRREQEEIDIRHEAKRNHYDKAQRESRQQLRAELERRGISARNVDAIIQDRDGGGADKNTVMQQFEAACAASGKEFNREHFERVYETTQRTRRNPEYRGRPQATFGIEVFNKDSSNRDGYRSEHTGWKYRKS